MTRRPLRALALIAAAVAIVLGSFAPGALARNLYAPLYDLDSVAVVDTATTQLVGAPIPTGPEGGPYGMAIAPDGRTVWVLNYDSGNLVSIDTATNQLTGSPIPVPIQSYGLAITPDGSRAFLTTSNDDIVTVVDLRSRQVIGAPIPVGDGPSATAITPDGSRAYVSNNADPGTLSVIDTATNQVVGAPVPIGGNPYNLAFTPDGRSLYVANSEGFVSVVDTATNTVGPPIPAGENTAGMAISPNGTRAYATNYDDETVTVIDTATRQVVGPPIVVSENSEYLAVTPDGTRLFVGQFDEPGRVFAFDTATNQLVGGPTTVGEGVGAIAIVPDQGPVAAFSVKKARPGVPVALNAGTSSDPDGTVTTFGWAFGDNKTATATKATVEHAYKKPGKYKATLTVTDNEGCSTALVFTGQTASCNGSAAATTTLQVKVAYPGVKLKCPGSAKPGGCKFKVKAVQKKGKKLKAQSAVAKAKVKPGKSKVVSLKPKKAFRKKLAKAKKVLVEEIVTIAGEQDEKVVKLKIVQ